MNLAIVVSSDRERSSRAVGDGSVDRARHRSTTDATHRSSIDAIAAPMPVRASNGPCYTPALTATTERSSAGTAPERARDGASRAGPPA